MVKQYDVSDKTTSLSPSFDSARQEGQWTIVFGEQPIDLNLSSKFDMHEAIAFISDNTIDHALSFINHNYIEIRDPGGSVMRRVHAQEVNMESSGTTMIGSYGSESLPFNTDQIYHDNGHPVIPNMLETGADAKEIKIIFSGTQEQILSVYHQILSDTIELHNQGTEYNASQTGNTVAAEFVEQVAETLAKHNLTLQETPDGGMWLWNNNLAYDPQKFTTQPGQAVCYESKDELISSISTLEDIVGNQVQQLQIGNQGLDLNNKIPEEAQLSCDDPEHTKSAFTQGKVAP